MTRAARRIMQVIERDIEANYAMYVVVGQVGQDEE